MMNNFFKNSLFSVFDFCGGNAFLRSICNAPIVLFWHSIANTYHPVIEAETVSTENFVKQIEYLHHKHNIISIDEYYKRYISHSFRGNEAVITFDDGYKNNLTIAAPILKRYDIPFTVFVSTNNIDLQDRFYVLDPRLIILGAGLSEVSLPSLERHYLLENDCARISCAYEIEEIMKCSSLDLALKIDSELRGHISIEQYEHLRQSFPNMEPMNWEDLQILSNNFNCTIGSHCVDHCCCHSKQSQEVLEFQIKNSKESIESHLNHSCDFFAYPNGNFCQESNDLVARYYKMGFSTRHQRVYQNEETLSNVCRVPAAHEWIKFKFLYLAQTMGIL